MGIFDRFRRGKGKEAPPPAPTPAPAPPPAPQPPAGEEKKRGFFGRLKDTVSRKKAPKAPPEAPPAAPPSPPAPPTGPPGGPMPEGPEEPEEGPPEKDYSGAPSSAAVRIAGTWQMSRKKWVGIVSGTLSGQDQVIEFLKALDEGREQDAVEMICEIFDDGSGFASAVDLDESHWETPVY